MPLTPSRKRASPPVIGHDEKVFCISRVVESGFLSTTDLGRLLLLTSKSMTTAAALEQNADENAVESWIYRLLANNYFGEEKTEELMSLTPLSPKEVFRSMASFENILPTPDVTLRPLQYSPNDYALFVDVHCTSGKKIFSKTLLGDQIPDFFADGYLCWNLEKPVVLSKVSRNQDLPNN